MHIPFTDRLALAASMSLKQLLLANALPSMSLGLQSSVVGHFQKLTNARARLATTKEYASTRKTATCAVVRRDSRATTAKPVNANNKTISAVFCRGVRSGPG